MVAKDHDKVDNDNNLEEKENTDTLEEVTKEVHIEVDNDIIWELNKILVILGPLETLKHWQQMTKTQLIVFVLEDLHTFRTKSVKNFV